MAEFGSFGNVSPDAMQSIKNALARRQQGGSVPALNQQSGASPTAAPLPAEPQGGLPMPQGDIAPPTQQTAPNPESRLIVSALKDRLKAISTVETGGLA